MLRWVPELPFEQYEIQKFDIVHLTDREIQLQKQVNDLKDQLGSCGG